MGNTKKKKKLNIKALLVILLTLYLIIMCFYYFLNLRIKNIVIKGTDTLSDQEIISAAGIDKNTKLFLTSSNGVEKKIKSIPLVKDVQVNKSFNGTITIKVEEARVLFYNILSNKYVLDTKKEVDTVSNPVGIPVLVNYVTNDIYENLIKKMASISSDVLALISEIEYAADIKDGVTIDANRFLLRMNDGNYIYINFAYFENLNYYKIIYAALDDQKGVLNFDSVYNSSNRYVFKTFEAINVEMSTEGGSDELSE